MALALMATVQAKAWWDHGHMVTAMIAYLNLNKTARAKVDSLTAVLRRDYPQVNHFIVMGPGQMTSKRMGCMLTIPGITPMCPSM
nr:hypothetical protein [Haliscomenobacter sp.]